MTDDVVKGFVKVTLDFLFQVVLLQICFRVKSWQCKLKLEKKERKQLESTKILFYGDNNYAKPATPLAGIVDLMK